MLPVGESRLGTATADVSNMPAASVNVHTEPMLLHAGIKRRRQTRLDTSASRIDSSYSIDPFLPRVTLPTAPSRRGTFDDMLSSSSFRDPGNGCQNAGFSPTGILQTQYTSPDRTVQSGESNDTELQKWHQNLKTGSRSHCLSTLSRMVASLGIVFSELATSPLYVFSSMFPVSKEDANFVPDANDVVGAISCIFWVLTFVVSLKYVLFTCSANFNSEGGVVAMYEMVMASLDNSPGRHTKSCLYARGGFLLVLTCVSASLYLCYSSITPTISVLAALEGVSLKHDSFSAYDQYVAAVVLCLLLMVQHKGTGKLGLTFGPIVLVWLIMAGGTGIYNIFQCQQSELLLQALNPLVGLKWLFAQPFHAGSVAALSSMVLTLTGVESVFLNMGHVGLLPCRLSWFFIVFPMLLIQYFGQGAYLINMLSESSELSADEKWALLDTVYWSSIPSESKILYIFQLIVAVAATIVASQSAFTSTFTILSQLSVVRLVPRLSIIRTSKHLKGQVYVPLAVKLLLVTSLTLSATIPVSEDLSEAFAFTAAMGFLTTSIMLTVYVSPFCWNLHPVLSVPLFLVFVGTDCLFCIPPLINLVHGGIAVCICAVLLVCVMLLWHKTSSSTVPRSVPFEEQNIDTNLAAETYDFEEALDQIKVMYRDQKVIHNNMLGIFLVPHWDDEDRVAAQLLPQLVWQLGAMPLCSVLLTYRASELPFIPQNDRLCVSTIDASLNLFRIQVNCGWAEPPPEWAAGKVLTRAANDSSDSIYPPTLRHYLQRAFMPSQTTSMNSPLLDSTTWEDSVMSQVSFFVMKRHLTTELRSSWYKKLTFTVYASMSKYIESSALEVYSLPSGTSEMRCVQRI